MPYSHLAQRSPHASKRLSFFIGLGQMFLMSANIRNMAKGHVVFLVCFTVVNTYVWLYIVRTAIHAKPWEKFFYALGSAGGAALGVIFSYYILEPYAVTRLASFLP